MKKQKAISKISRNYPQILHNHFSYHRKNRIKIGPLGEPIPAGVPSVFLPGFQNFPGASFSHLNAKWHSLNTPQNSPRADREFAAAPPGGPASKTARSSKG